MRLIKIYLILMPFTALIAETCQQENPSSCCLKESEAGCMGTFGSGGNWLYLQPLSDAVPYAHIIQPSSTTFTGMQKATHSEFSSGYELFAFYKSGHEFSTSLAWDVRFSYAFYKNSTFSSSEVIAPTFMTSLVGFTSNETAIFSQAKIGVKDAYQALSGDWGIRLFEECPLLVRLFGGVFYANLKQKLKVTYAHSLSAAEATTKAKEVSSFHGIGPRAGFTIQADLVKGLGLQGDFSANLLFAKTKATLFQESSDFPSSSLNWKEKTHFSNLLPNLDLKMGLNYAFQRACFFSFYIEGGYRALYYFDALKQIQGSFSISESSFTLWAPSKNFGLSGWFLGGALLF